MLPKGPYNAQDIEPEILDYWLENKFFKPEYHPEKGLQTLEEMKKDGRESFCIVNPPPNAYMRPHIGNVSGYAYQDVFLRYNRMLGKKVLGQPGKDHAGIQGEVVLEKIFRENKGKEKHEMGREKFYIASYSHFLKLMPMVMDDEQRIGLSSDYDRNLFTLDPRVVETVLGTFTKMFEDKMIYKGVRIVNWDPVAKTTLADIDTEREERDGELVYINYQIAPFDKAQELSKAQNTKLKTIVFDLHGVILHSDSIKKYKKLSNLLGINNPEDLRAFMNGKSSDSYHKGNIGYEQFWEQLAEHFGVKDDLAQQYLETWSQSYSLDKELVRYIEELKKDSFKIGFFSNNSIERIEQHDKDFNIRQLADFEFYTAEEGSLKPEQEAYQKFVSKFKLNPKEILFIDDKFENLKPAKELGWKIFHYADNVSNLREYIEKGNEYVTVATTRAETMLGDTAVVVNPKDERYKDLVGKKLILPIVNREIPVITSAHVDMEFGTGAVKLTPAHSMDDYKMMTEWNTAYSEERTADSNNAKHNTQNTEPEIGYINIIDKSGRMTGPIPVKYKGLTTEECRKVVIEDLEKLGLVIKREPHKMNVTVGERSKAVVEQIMSSQWFIDVEKLKQPAIDVIKNDEIQIHPEYMKKKYLHWMENLHDWPVSRSLWWGYRIPVWYKGEIREEINQETGQIVETIGGVEVTGIYDAVEKGLAKVQIEDPNEEQQTVDSRQQTVNLKPTMVTIVRHGETDDNKEKRFIGSRPTPLNETGRTQAKEFADKLNSNDFDLVISSPLQRARETAEIINAKLNLPIEFDARIQERNFGVIEGMTWDEIEKEMPELAKSMNESYQIDLPEGESLESVNARIDEFIDDLKTKYAGKRILIVTHTGATRIFRRRLGGESVEKTREIDTPNLGTHEYSVGCTVNSRNKTQNVQSNATLWHQDPDVFDTWFSSGQWAYATLEANDLMDTFYPSDIMETAYDILELWVSRMIMLSLYTQGKIPFKNVYLHGLVKAPDGQKMSKSKGNVIQPEEIINKYGADALRLMYVVGNKAGSGYPISYEKLEGYKRFLNKIWNASKFVLNNVKDLDERYSQNESKSQISNLKSRTISNDQDKKIINEIVELKETVTRHMEAYRIGMAAEEIYNHFWHTFCDVHLEEVKSRLYTKDKEGNPINQSEEAKADRKQAQQTLLWALSEYLKLLHPFVPFITERLWQEISEGTIMYQRWE